MKNVGNNSRGRSQGVPKIFRTPMYRAHCAVIFAIAQLSCFAISFACPDKRHASEKGIAEIVFGGKKYVYTQFRQRRADERGFSGAGHVLAVP